MEPPACKLCRALAASGFPTQAERGVTAGVDAFTRDKDICDACLNVDYGPRPGLGLLGMASLILAALIALPLATVLVAKGIVPIASSGLASVIVLALGGTLLIAAIVRASLPLLAKLWLRKRAAPTDPAEQAADAERLYWMAVCVGVKGQTRLRRKLLKNARSLGFNDERRLADPRLA